MPSPRGGRVLWDEVPTNKYRCNRPILYSDGTPSKVAPPEYEQHCSVRVPELGGRCPYHEVTEEKNATD